ncbi:accumulation and replication of chloroplast-related protein [Raphidocelis subcapitata]|uniref:Accumulation and replication of chloroplast-related protein n=1 Tax=Raphidocelis subcapitata TaxID=307507 RepID=A0A2V0NPY2_9CHLO|nr:accumulation and replication of chloroplast-related protein [Raphidocelis subcapitata]|eukprot:GBF87573.1 accumulation and replication of chloroplast-related protein [Raphidocelis subcapitata]
MALCSAVRPRGPLGLAAGKRPAASRPGRLAVARRVPAPPAPRRAPLAAAAAAAPDAAAPPSDTITLPLNFYSLLHVNRASSREAVRRAYERVLSAPPDVGYTQDTLFSRAVLLKSAAECLSDLDARRAYDAAAAAGGGAHTVDVTRDNLPGALVLLQEAGESALVLALGCRWLESQERAGGDPSRAADVAAAVALALCDLAAQALEEGSGQVLGACERLEEALALLRRHGLAPQLQQQIGDTLEDFAPRYCLELLELPLGPDAPTAERRAHGLALARQLLWSAQDHPSLAGARGEFADCVRSQTTAAEQLELYRSPPAGAAVSLREQLDCALAAVAVGLEKRSPGLLARADGMYAAVEAAVEREGAPVDVSVERASIALLLGDARRAAELLGLSGEGAGAAKPANPEVLAFVRDHSPDPSDLLPGVYTLARGWVAEAVLPSFRDTAGSEVDLEGWFQSPWVQAYAQARSLTGSISPGGAATALRAALAALFAFAAAVVARVVAAFGAALSGQQRRGQAAAPAAAAAPAGGDAANPAPRRRVRMAPPAARTAGAAQEERAPRGSRAAAAAASAAAAAASAAAASDAAAAAEPDQQQRRQRAVASTRAQFEKEAEDSVLEFDRSKLEQEVVTVAELKRRLGAVLSDGDGAAADKWRRGGGDEQAAAEGEDDDTDARLFQGKAYQAKRDYLQRLEVQMWDSEPGAAGGLASALRRWLAPLAGVALLGALLWGRVGGERAAASAPAGAQAAVTVQKQKASAPAAATKAAAANAAADAPSAKPAAAEPAARARRGGGGAAAAVAAGSPIGAEEAARVISRLQSAKAAAMGPEHRVGELRGVMRGRLLRHWRGQAERAREAGSHYVYSVRSTRLERAGPWLPRGWLARALSRGAELAYVESDTVTARRDPAAGRAAGRGDSADRTLRRTVRLQKARWLPGAEWRAVDAADVAA